MTKTKAPPPISNRLALRPPVADDGYAVHELIALCPPLDTNSVYCNLLQCTHFAGTSVLAECDGRLCGFISGYLVPGQPNSLFIWQVAVASQARGQGLGNKMLREILARPECRDVSYLETTITTDNEASWRLFNGLARDLGGASESRVLFAHQRHFGGKHDTEILLRIGPFSQRAPDQVAAANVNCNKETSNE